MSNFPLQNAAEQLAKQGRYGDTMMVHMNPIEVDALAKLSPTGQLTINPQTGQPEAFLPLIGSLIAPTLLGGTALGAALSPLAASAIGTGLGTVAEGGSLKEGITAGLTAANDYGEEFLESVEIDHLGGTPKSAGGIDY